MDGLHHAMKGIAHSSPILVEYDLYFFLFIVVRDQNNPGWFQSRTQILLPMERMGPSLI